MTNKSAADLEKDAEIARARVPDTARSIRDKMSPGQLIDEFASVFSGGDGSAALQNLKAQVRDNPLPVALVSAGLAWLMLGQGPATSDIQREGRTTAPFRDGGSRPNSHPSASSKEGFTAAAGNTLSDAARSTSSAAGETASLLRDGARQLGDQLSGTTHASATGAGELAAKARSGARELLQRDPLMVAALGVVIGAAVGTLLPHSSFEDQQMGPAGAKLRGSAEELFSRGVEEVKDVAAEAYETLKVEADEQGLSAPGGLVEKATKLVGSTVAKTEDAVRHRINPGPQKDPSRTG